MLQAQQNPEGLFKSDTLGYNTLMNQILDWESYYHKELQQAEAARAAGNEGKARVCARRAAGISLGEYFRRRSQDIPGHSAYDRLKYLCNQPDTTGEVQTVAAHFLLRVTPEYILPLEIDLIADARWLTAALLGISKTGT